MIQATSRDRVPAHGEAVPATTSASSDARGKMRTILGSEMIREMVLK
jgi:hypothetical protein